MAGRGCTVTVRIARRVLLEGEARHASAHHSGAGNGASTTGNEASRVGDLETSEISLPVALHSPLSVLRSMLQHISGIDVAEQVLVLCDLTDPDRNRDVLLAEHWNDSTLGQCGIVNGSFLTLHALGIAPDSGNTGSSFHDLLRTRRDTKAAAAPVESDPRPMRELKTSIGPAEANHSYNGVMFDVHAKSPFEIDLYSVHVGGMLGRVRVFGRHGSWKATPEERSREGGRGAAGEDRWWAINSDNVAKEGWILLADAICAPSWDKTFEIPFKLSIRILPSGTCAIYIHSSLPDDLGLQYQSYSKTSVVAEDEHLKLTPGLGHTGAVPFDEEHGWYRAYRALSGKLSYRCHRKGWSMWTHSQFPAHLRDTVCTMLLCRYHSERRLIERSGGLGSPRAPASPSTASPQLELGCLHTYLLYYIMEFMDWDWAPDPLQMDDEDRPAAPSRGGLTAQMRRHLMQLIAEGMPWGVVGQALGMDSIQDILDLLNGPVTGDSDSEDGDYVQQGEDDDDDDEDDDEDYIDEEDEEDMSHDGDMDVDEDGLLEEDGDDDFDDAEGEGEEDAVDEGDFHDTGDHSNDDDDGDDDVDQGNVGVIDAEEEVEGGGLSGASHDDDDDDDTRGSDGFDSADGGSDVSMDFDN